MWSLWPVNVGTNPEFGFGWCHLFPSEAYTDQAVIREGTKGTADQKRDQHETSLASSSRRVPDLLFKAKTPSN